jgi:hypothetical protein
MYWALLNLKDSENKTKILHYGSIFSAATVCLTSSSVFLQTLQTLCIRCRHIIRLPMGLVHVPIPKKEVSRSATVPR